MRYIIIGTAGHIDHGKSSIVKELTGFWGDESKEEKRRGITIDLSFSYLKNNDTTLAFIDVPGHEKLISTMISGAFGFDMSLVVIDANEGIMPQTKEHLSVLSYAGVSECIVALSKCDLASKEQIQTQMKAVQEELKNYNIKPKAILPTSIHDKNSIEKLKEVLFSLEPSKAHEDGVFRCYIDRAFNIKGAGLVITGSIAEGKVNIGDRLWVNEKQKFCEVRNIQVHEQNTQSAIKGQRVALNLTGISDIQKGMQLSKKGYLRGFKTIDIVLDKPLKHNLKVSFCVGSKKVNGKVLHLEDRYASFVSEEELFCKFEDRFVLLQNGSVIGGGKILNPITDPIKKAKKLPILKALEQREFKTAFTLLTKAHKKGFGMISSYQRFGLAHEQILDIVKELDGVFLDEESLVVYPKTAVEFAKELIVKIFEKNPHALISPNSIKHKWISKNLALKALEHLKEQDKVTTVNGLWAKQGVDAKNLKQNIENKIYSIITEGGVSPLAPYNIYDELDVDRKVGDDALKKLTKAKKVVRLEHNFFISSEVLSKVMSMCRQIITTNGYIDIKILKEKLSLSRKYLIAYLEYLDKYEDVVKVDTKRVFK